jgi:hypothetical protein
MPLRRWIGGEGSDAATRELSFAKLKIVNMQTIACKQLRIRRAEEGMESGTGAFPNFLMRQKEISHLDHKDCLNGPDAIPSS